ncbi:MAG: hypothetical protein ACREUW_02635 [Burkholderiales bacterium]
MMKKFYLFREPLAQGIFLLGVIIALFAPTDIVDRLPRVRQISIPLSQVFPPIEWYIKKSSFPQVTELYFTVMWLLSPLSFYWMGKDLAIEPKIGEWKKTLEERVIVLTIGRILFVLILIPLLLLGGWYFNQGYDFLWLPVNSSRFALATGGYLLAGTGGWWVLQFGVLLLHKALLDIQHLRA